ncbi:MAG: hypothetical protein DRG09_06145 [Epsilonproteobacteria bacterium]|nr:MAG: hypothetical protein DRG09_06145 [Campylobacterota bacterium]
MIIFGYNLLFQDEPIFQDSVPANGLETIQVIEYPDFALEQIFKLKSAWFEMTERDVRYLSHKPFNEAGKTFSWALEIKDIVTLVWESEKKEILYKKGKYYTPALLHFWILHTFLPLVFELERIYRILHVGAVEVAGNVILFSAFSFGGKSTLTDYFIKKGHTMLSDDTLGIVREKDGYKTIASYPFHRPYRKAEELGYPVKNFRLESKSLHSIYLLEKDDPAAKVGIEEIKGIEKFKVFYSTSFVNFDFMKRERFEFFSAMSKHISVYRVTVPWDMERLNEVYHAIIKNVK